MGRGDKKTRKGKIAIGSYGNTRKRATKAKTTKAEPKKSGETAAAEAPAKPKRTPRKKSEA